MLIHVDHSSPVVALNSMNYCETLCTVMWDVKLFLEVCTFSLKSIFPPDWLFKARIHFHPFYWGNRKSDRSKIETETKYRFDTQLKMMKYMQSKAISIFFSHQTLIHESKQ